MPSGRAHRLDQFRAGIIAWYEDEMRRVVGFRRIIQQSQIGKADIHRGRLAGP